MVKLQELKGRYFVSIPKEYIKRKGWVKGQELLFSFGPEGQLEILCTDPPEKQ